jgi:methionine aminopeptidase
VIRKRDDRELEKMHQANAIVLRILEVLTRALEPGITTAELDRIAAAEIAREGATPAFKGYRGFPANLCVSRRRCAGWKGEISSAWTWERWWTGTSETTPSPPG